MKIFGVRNDEVRNKKKDEAVSLLDSAFEE